MARDASSGENEQPEVVAWTPGPTEVFASRHDPRFSYCLYLPPQRGDGKPTELLVAVHGSLRLFIPYRDAFSAFAEWNNCIVLAPLFPSGVLGDENGDGYKYLYESDLRYDRVLLAMVAEVAQRYHLTSRQFGLLGYSGGGHFAHRFYTLHPERLWAVSIGAPGSVTLLDPNREWWMGVRNTREMFGVQVDIAAMRRVPVQMIVGRVDLETYEIVHREDDRYWLPGANDAGPNRPARLAALRDSYASQGIAVRFDVLPDVAHDAMRCAKAAESFLAEALRARRAVAAD